MIQMKIKDKLISNATYLSLKWGFNTIFFLAFWLILGKVIFPEDTASYGVVALALQVITLLSNWSLFGMDAAIAKLIPEMVEKKQNDRIFGLTSYALKIAFILSIVISMGLVLFSFVLPNIIKLNTQMLTLVVITTVATVVAVMLENVYYGLQKMKKVFLTNLYGWITMIVLVIVFMFLDFGYLGPIIAVLSSFVVMILTRVKKRFITPPSKIHVDKKTIYKYSAPAFVVIILSSILNNSQFIILSALKTFEDTGHFAVAMKIVSVIIVIPTTFSGALFPITSGLSVDKNSKSKQSYLISLVFRYTVLIIMPIVLFTIVFSKYLIIFFSSEEYLAAAKFLPILVTGGLFLGVGQQFRSSLYAIGKPKKFRDSYIASTVTYVLLSIPLTYYFSSMGLSVAYFISAFILFLTTLIFIRRTINFRMPFSDILKVIVAIFASFLFLLASKPFIPDILVAIPFVITASLIYLIILLKLDFYVEEDLKFFDFVVTRMPVFKKQTIQFRKFLSKHIKRSYKLDI
jgi:O-antigen/teichoic acid export membrane protein